MTKLAILPKSKPYRNEQGLAYLLALALVERIDTNLELGRVHYRDKAGRLLTTLDEAVRAILADDLEVPNAN